jgi:hypothetical protein
MKSIKENFLKKYGYTPDDNDILNLYLTGELLLTDRQENELLKYFNF